MRCCSNGSRDCINAVFWEMRKETVFCITPQLQSSYTDPMSTLETGWLVLYLGLAHSKTRCWWESRPWWFQISPLSSNWEWLVQVILSFGLREEEGDSSQSLFFVCCPVFYESWLTVYVRYKMVIPAPHLPGVWPLSFSGGRWVLWASSDTDWTCVLVTYPRKDKGCVKF